MLYSCTFTAAPFNLCPVPCTHSSIDGLICTSFTAACLPLCPMLIAHSTLYRTLQRSKSLCAFHLFQLSPKPFPPLLLKIVSSSMMIYFLTWSSSCYSSGLKFELQQIQLTSSCSRQQSPPPPSSADFLCRSRHPDHPLPYRLVPPHS